jgi:hypothetical protein
MPTKPIISYVEKTKKPIEIDKTSIVSKKISKTEYKNWVNKLELTSFINTLYRHPSSNSYLYVICSCSREYNYTNQNEVPSGNKTCRCGRKIIEYSN